MFANFQTNVPIFGGLPIWLGLICITAVLLLGSYLNNAFFGWFRQRWPGYFQPRNLLAILVLCILVIAAGMWINPPSKMREEFRRAHPEPVGFQNRPRSETRQREVAVPPLSGRVVDVTGTLTDDAIASLTKTLRDLEARKGSQIAVLLVPTTQPETIEQYSLRVAKDWKIGRNKIDDGVIIVVAKGDYKLRIEVGYGLEGALTKFTAQHTIDDNIVPRFRVGDFAGGISAGIMSIIGVIENAQLPPP